MVGEVRDLDTAQIAVRASLTGHLVFSTLHTNDAASGITRLIDIGVEAYLVSSSLEAIIAQRLVRTICPYCKKLDKTEMPELRAQIARDINLTSIDKVKIYKSEGCEKCNFTGFHGRTAIYEILLLDEVMKELILKKTSSNQLKRHAMSMGMRSLRQDGWHKVIEGLTTPEEVINVTPAEENEISPKKEINLKEKDENIKSPLPQTKQEESALSRRTYMRLEKKISISYRLVVEKGALVQFSSINTELEYSSSTKDISAGGIQFFSDRLVPLGSILELRIDLPDGGNKSIECFARVERLEEIKKDKIYTVAVCFLDMSSADRVRIDRYIKTLMNEQEF
jgi:hypothetical protein